MGGGGEGGEEKLVTGFELRVNYKGSPQHQQTPSLVVLAGSPSPGGDVTVFVKDINQPSSSTPFYSVLVSISVFTPLSTVFHSINSPDNLRFLSLFFRSYLCLIVPFNCMSFCESFLQP